MPETTTAFRIAAPAWTATISNNPYSPDYLNLATFALMGLAEYSNNSPYAKKSYFYPELASSWNVSKHEIVLHLRRSAKWQNGEPFTSKDVLDSFLLSGADGNSLWADFSKVTAPSPHEVVFDLFSWVVPQNILMSMFGVVILPASQYGSLIPAGLEQDLYTYWKLYDFLHPTTASTAAAAGSAAGKTMTNVVKVLTKFNPKQLIGDGPYTLQADTEGGILYKKWMGWWDAKTITVPWIEVVPESSAGAAFEENITGGLDWQQSWQYPDPQVSKIDHSTYGHYVFIPSPVQEESLVFHLTDYPYSLLQVRQALAYVINRVKLAKLDMGGTIMQDPPAQNPDGINHVMAERYLSTSQFKKLKHYNYDPAKAAKLLESVGFKKKNGTWYTPKGTPWKVTITEEGGYTQFMEDGLVITNDLKRFGIKTSEVATAGTVYYTQQTDGDYAISEQFMDWGGTNPNPLADFAATFGGPPWVYPASYNGKGAYKGTVAIGIGPISDVPGLGKVNIAAALQSEVNTAPPSSWAKYTWDWARWVNENLPILPLYDNAFHNSYTTSRYVDFPPTSKSWMWTDLSQVPEPILWMQNGYLHLRHS